MRYLLCASLVVVTLVASGCSISFGNSSGSAAKKVDASVWRSADGGAKWVPVVKLATTGTAPQSIANVSVTRVIVDPQDANAMYLATAANGIVYTYDGGASWRQFKELNKGLISAVVVDPQQKCTLYAIVATRLYKSEDCGRVWQDIYQHQVATVALTDLVVDNDSSDVVYMSDSKGEVLKSIDGGITWETVFRAKAGIIQLVTDPHDRETIYAATQNNGLYHTTDSGANWSDLGAGIKSYIGSHQFRQLIAEPATPGGLILISKYGMLRSIDSGLSWEIVELLPAPKAATIYAVAVNPRNSDEIYYATRNALVKTTNGGETWSSLKLPTARVPAALVVNPDTTDVVYLGTRSEK